MNSIQRIIILCFLVYDIRKIYSFQIISQSYGNIATINKKSFCASPSHGITNGISDSYKNYRPHSNVFRSSTEELTDNEKEDDVVVDVDYEMIQSNTIQMKRSDMISIAQECRTKYGYILNPFIIPKSIQNELYNSITELEYDYKIQQQNKSLFNQYNKDKHIINMLLGDWDLICTIPIINNNQQQVSQQIPSLLDIDLIKNIFPSSSSLPVASLTNKFVTITQRIRNIDNENDHESTNIINRVDHVIEIKPPNQLSDLFETSNTGGDAWWNNININPLDIKASKVILIHNATIDSKDNDDDDDDDDDDTSTTTTSSDDDTTPFKVRLQLQSIVNNIAGTGGNLNPNGSDIISINVPKIPDFLNLIKQQDDPQNTKKLINTLNDIIGGTFVTTYIDDEYRISRSTVLPLSINNDSSNNQDDNVVQQIRIFQKRRNNPTTTSTTESDFSIDIDDYTDNNDIEPPSDVEDI